MAYIYVKGNEYLPFDNLGDDLADIGCSLSSGFDVDTLLAYPIAVLNNKGYITSLSCEGHPLGEVYYETEEEHQKRMLSDNSDRKRVFDTRKNKDGINYVCIEGQPNKEAYIMFKEEIILPTSVSVKPDGVA